MLCHLQGRQKPNKITNDGSLAHMRKERKIVWIFPSASVQRCPVRLVDKYLSLCSEVGPKNKPNFYLRSLEKTNPVQWYSTQVLGINIIRKTVGKMLKDAQPAGFPKLLKFVVKYQELLSIVRNCFVKTLIVWRYMLMIKVRDQVVLVKWVTWNWVKLIVLEIWWTKCWKAGIMQRQQ